MANEDTWGESSCPGYNLHRTVDRNRWCVEKKDLADFRGLVGKAIREGRIQPTELDPFDPADKHIGPNVYTVNEQFIKPVTRDAGMMSWALMLHPDGLQCDLYVTHAWAEGVFEFIDKVLHSWPQRARHAYCCMLGNPQNLDISGLIRTPQESPFASALSSAQYLLVIPNQRVSVYMRLWCAYEAFLAHNSNMEIMVACAPASANIVRACAMALLSAVAGAAAGLLRHLHPGEMLTIEESIAMWPAMALLSILSVILGNGRWRRLCNFSGCFLTVYFATVADIGCYLMAIDIGCDWMKRTHTYMFRFVLLCGCVYYVMAEADRVREERSLHERSELTNGYTGSILDAQCSDPRDSDAIYSEIGSKIGEVDMAIKVLLEAGVWTASLRRVFEAGVDVKDAGHVEFAAISATAAFTLFSVGKLFSIADLSCDLLGSSILVVQFGHIIPMCKQQDSRAFGFSVLGRLSQIWMLLAFAIHIVFVEILGMSYTDVVLNRMQASLCLVVHLLAFLLSLAGAEQVAGLPYFGPVLTQILMARGLGCCADKMICCSVTTRCSQCKSRRGDHSSSNESRATRSSNETMV